MLAILRKIRKSLIDSGSTRKYLLYAIGEVALVVIGILIALQINNWSEIVKNKVIERNFHSNLTIDLERDSDKLESLNHFFINRLNQLDWIINEIRSPQEDPDIEEFAKRIEPLHYVEDGVSYSATFDAAKSSGDFSKFRDKEIVKDLNQYYAEFKKVDDILSSTIRLVDSRLEPLLATIPENYLDAESGKYVVAMEDNSDFYKYISSIEDTRTISIDLKAFLQKPELENVIIGDIGRSYHALSIISKRKEWISEIKEKLIPGKRR